MLQLNDINKIVKVYTPLILSFLSLINSIVLSIEGLNYYFNDYITINLMLGYIFLDLYILSVSRKLCFWYKLNIIFLFLAHISGFICSIICNVNIFRYSYVIMTLSSLSIICFLVFKVFYKTIIIDKKGRNK